MRKSSKREVAVTRTFTVTVGIVASEVLGAGGFESVGGGVRVCVARPAISFPSLPPQRAGFVSVRPRVCCFPSTVLKSIVS